MMQGESKASTSTESKKEGRPRRNVTEIDDTVEDRREWNETDTSREEIMSEETEVDACPVRETKKEEIQKVTEEKDEVLRDEVPEAIEKKERLRRKMCYNMPLYCAVLCFVCILFCCDCGTLSCLYILYFVSFVFVCIF